MHLLGRIEERPEETKPLDVIYMQMSQQDIDPLILKALAEIEIER
jgi:hypothetical protein